MTAMLQLRHSNDPPESRCHDRSLDRRPNEARAVLASFDRSSSALSHQVTAFSSVHPARSVASDVLCRSHPRGSTCGRPPGPAARSSHPPLPRQRKRSPKDQDVFHRQVLPPPFRLTPGSCGRFRLAPSPHAGARNHEQPAASSPMFPPERDLRCSFNIQARRLNGQAQANSSPSLRPAAKTPEPNTACRLLQPVQSVSTTLGLPNPQSLTRQSVPSLRWTGRKSPERVEAPSALPSYDPGGAFVDTSRQTLRSDHSSPLSTSRAYAEQRPADFHRPAPLVTCLEADGRASPRSASLGHLSSRDYVSPGRRSQRCVLHRLGGPTLVHSLAPPACPSCANTRREANVASARPAFARPAFQTSGTNYLRSSRALVRIQRAEPARADWLA